MSRLSPIASMLVLAFALSAANAAPPRSILLAPDGSMLAAEEAPRAFDPQRLRSGGAFGAFRELPGDAGIVARDADGDGIPQLYVGDTRTSYELSFAPGAGFTQRAFHGYVENLSAIRVGPVGTGEEKIVVLAGDRIEIYGAVSGDLVTSFPHGGPCCVYALAIGDVDPSPGWELLVSARGFPGESGFVRIYVEGSATPIWSATALGARELVVGQMDGDAAPEFAVGAEYPGAGVVFDAATRTEQWVTPYDDDSFGELVDAGDVDGDGLDEVVASFGVFDVDSQTRRWRTQEPVSAVRAADIDGDGRAEAIHAYEKSVTEGEIVWSDGDGNRGGSLSGVGVVTAVEVADVDGDCAAELVYGMGGTGQFDEGLAIREPASGAVEWSNAAEAGFVSDAFAVGDADRDGTAEVVRSILTVAGDARIVVSDLHHRRDETRLGSITALGSCMAMASLDLDGALEYVVADAEGSPSAGIVAFDGITHLEEWSASLPGASVLALHVGDPDGDGTLDVVAGTAAGDLLVLRGIDGHETWRTTAPSGVQNLRVADIDGDGGTEIVVGRGFSGIRVYDGISHVVEWDEPTSSPIESLDVGDYDSDGDMDLVAGWGGRVQVWDGLSKATVASLDLGHNGAGSVTALDVADVDGDGRNELLVCHQLDPASPDAWLLSAIDPAQGGIVWSSDVVNGRLGGSNSIFAGDADDDGQVEILAPSFDGLWIWEYEAGSDVVPPVWPGPVGIQSVSSIGPGCCPALDLSWELADDAASPPVTYAVYRGGSPTFQPSAANLVAHVAGASFRDTGVSLGSPHYYVVRARDARGNEEANGVHAGSYAGGIDVTPAALPAGAVGVVYAQSLAASGGTAPYTFSLSEGALPVGLFLSSAGVIDGIPVVAAAFGFTVRVSDSVGCGGSLDYVLVVGGGTGVAGNVVAGQGFGPPSSNRVAAFRQDGSATPADFLAYAANAWGVAASIGWIGASGAEDHLVTGPGPGPVFGPQVRAFMRDGAPIAKVSFYAYGTLRFGVNAAVAALDADAPLEIVTGAGPGDVFGPHVRGWNFDGGTLSPIGQVGFFAYGTLRYGVNVASGDVDGDAYGEMISGAGPGIPFAPQVRGFDYDGSAVSSMARVNFVAFGVAQYGANVASGALEPDAGDELAAALGPGPSHAPRLAGFDFDGVSIASLPGLDVTLPTATAYGARAGVAEITGDTAAELLGGAGRDPAASSVVRPYVYAGATATPLVAIDAFPGSTYGVNVAGGELSY